MKERIIIECEQTCASQDRKTAENRLYAYGQRLHTIRTPGGINIGDAVPIEGRRGIRIRQGKKEECLLPEDIVTCITGKQVIQIVYKNEQEHELMKN